MPQKPDWTALTHDQRVRVLAEHTIETILGQYHFPGDDIEAFRTVLVKEQRLWEPRNLGAFKKAGSPPTKEVILGAWRDLDKSEALLELIDNSIDAWKLRRDRYPAKTAAELIINIRIDRETQQLTYEDNAGGLPEEKLSNLVVPGYSDTTDLTPTIGSYRTGGKKAIFRLATEASITTRYWNPAVTTDEAWSIQLDDRWLQDANLYEFPYAPLTDRSTIERGQTRYTFQLREEPVGGTPWFLESDEVKKVTNDIRRTYTLLLIRNPEIHIFFQDMKNPLPPIKELYEFSGTNEDGTDIRPQQVNFTFQLFHEGRPHEIRAEVVLGSRVTSGSGEGPSRPGIDLYGNDRLFTLYDLETFAGVLPSGGSRNLVRGFVNIHGPNVFIPWDTHKRHLNRDREIMKVLMKNKLITDFFDSWYRAYQDIGRGDVSRLIETKLPQPIDEEGKDLFIPHRADVAVDLNRKRGVSLPKTVSAPKVNSRKREKEAIKVSISFDVAELRLLLGYYELEGSASDPPAALLRKLSDAMRADVLNRARKTPRTRRRRRT
jgi:hypothetical protein